MNEILLILSCLICASYVFISWSLGKERLYTAIIIFLALIATVGGKIVEFFGFETNTGNIFYASVFLATYFLIERYGKHEGARSIWIGVMSVVFFLGLAHATVTLIGSDATAPLNDALRTAFGPTLRIAFASLLAYTLSQSLNVYLYVYLKEKLQKRRLWLRANISNAIAQALDSVVFFIVAFWGVVPLSAVIEVLVFGYAIKVVYMMLVSPILYFNKVEAEVEEEYVTVTIR
jgi:hypothetical protein